MERPPVKRTLAPNQNTLNVPPTVRDQSRKPTARELLETSPSEDSSSGSDTSFIPSVFGNVHKDGKRFYRNDGEELKSIDRLLKQRSAAGNNNANVGPNSAESRPDFPPTIDVKDETEDDDDENRQPGFGLPRSDPFLRHPSESTDTDIQEESSGPGLFGNDSANRVNNAPTRKKEGSPNQGPPASRTRSRNSSGPGSVSKPSARKQTASPEFPNASLHSPPPERRSVQFQQPKVLVTRMSMSPEHNNESDSPDTPRKLTLKELQVQVPKTNLENVGIFIDIKLHQARDQKEIVMQLLSKIEAEEMALCEHRKTVRELKIKLEKSKVSGVLRKKTEPLTLSSFELFNYIEKWSKPECLQALQHNSPLEKLSAGQILFVMNEIQNWEMGTVVHKFEHLSFVNLSNVVTINRINWQVKLQVKVEGETLNLAAILVCLGHRLRSMAKIPCLLEVSGTISVKFQIPSVSKDFNEQFKFANDKKIKFPDKKLGHEILVTSFRTYNENFSLGSCQTSSCDVTCKLAVKEPETVFSDEQND